MASHDSPRFFLTYSRLIWQSSFNIKNHRKTSPTGHQRPAFAVVKFKISPVAPPFGLSPLLGTFVTNCGVHPHDFITLRLRFSLFSSSFLFLLLQLLLMLLFAHKLRSCWCLYTNLTLQNILIFFSIPLPRNSAMGSSALKGSRIFSANYHLKRHQNIQIL